MTLLAERDGLESELSMLREMETNCVDSPSATRKKVTDPKQRPYKWICRTSLSHDSASAPKGGTGLLIGPKHVLTAAHVILEKGASVKKVEVTPAAAASWSAPFGVYESRNRFVLNGYGSKQQATADDIGLIELSKPVSYGKSDLWPYYGYLPIAALAPTMGIDPPENFLGLPDGLTEIDMVGKDVTSIGYPGDQRNSMDQMWETAGKIVYISRKYRLVRISLDGCTGQSGSPVFLNHGNDRYVIGVLSSADLKAKTVTAALLTPAVVAGIRCLQYPVFRGPLAKKDEG